MMTSLSRVARSESDPKVISSGPSSFSNTDRAARLLGWFSIGLGVAELVAAERITRALGMEGKEGLVRSYGVREIGAGMLCLSVNKNVGMWSRVAGDALDLATVAAALTPDNPKRQNAGVALALLAGVTLLDLAVAAGSQTQHGRSGPPRDYGDRSGFPGGTAAARGVARRDFETPPDMRAAPAYNPS